MGHLSFTEILDTSLKVSWQEPLEKNGIITGSFFSLPKEKIPACPTTEMGTATNKTVASAGNWCTAGPGAEAEGSVARVRAGHRGPSPLEGSSPPGL